MKTKKQQLCHGYLDESGILERGKATGGQFVVAVVIVADRAILKHVMRSARKKARGTYRFHSVFKASRENKGFVKLVLQEIALREVGIVIGVWDKKKRSVTNKRELYGMLVAKTVAGALSVFGRLQLTIHKRYTSPNAQSELHGIISKYASSGSFLTLDQRTETQVRELELADAVAWAVYQKYNKKDAQYYDVIKKKITKENRLTA